MRVAVQSPVQLARVLLLSRRVDSPRECHHFAPNPAASEPLTPPTEVLPSAVSILSRLAMLVSLRFD